MVYQRFQRQFFQLCQRRVGIAENPVHGAALLVKDHFNVGKGEGHGVEAFVMLVIFLGVGRRGVVLHGQDQPTYSELEPQQTESCIHQNVNSVRVAAILSFIEQHYPENITLSNIAEIANISEREALRCFKKITGESPIQYLLKYRLIRSASVLTEYPDKNISIVAEECGFDSPAYYTKKFKEFYLCSPREYRQVHQAVF